MEKGSSPLDTLRQLRELLDAGTITPQEFETLKGRLLAEQPAPPTVPLNPTFTAPTASPETTSPARPEPETTQPTSSSPANGPAEELPPLLDFFKQPQTPSSSPQPPVAPVSPDRPAYTAPSSAPVVPPAPPAPDFYPPRPATPPTPPASTTPPQFYPPTPPPPASAAPPEFFSPRTPPTPAPPVEPVRPVAPPVTVKPLVVTPAPAAQAPELDEDDEEEDAPAKSPLGKILAIGGGLLLVALIWYLVAGQSRSSEHLTSISQTAADTVAVTPETGPQAEQLDLPPAAAPETVRVAPVIPPVSADTAATAAAGTTEEPQATQVTPPVTETKPAENANEATDRVRDVLAAYYADIQAPPFNADQYFAPQVDLFVILRNTTPAAISAWLEQNRFAELKDAQFQVEPGSLRVAPPANDGSRVVTYIERGRGFRQSLQKNQYIRAQMRLRLNPDYKITYQKQERLLENTLTDPVAPPPTPE